MKRFTIIFACLLFSVIMIAEQHMMFRSLPIDGDLKTAMKEVKKWGFMGMKIKNVAAMMGSLDGEDVLLTLIATPETNTLFSVSIIYEGVEQWEEHLARYQSINDLLAAEYGEPTKVLNQWAAPYSMDNNPIQAFKEQKAIYSSMYSTQGGTVAINMVYIDGKMCTLVAYVDEQNAALYKAEGGTDILIDEDTEVDAIE